MKHKFLLQVSSILLCLSLLLLNVNGTEVLAEGAVETSVTLFSVADMPNYASLLSGSAAEAAAEAAIVDALTNVEDKLDVTEYQLDMQEAMALFISVVQKNPQLFYVNTGVGAYEESQNGTTKVFLNFKNEGAPTYAAYAKDAQVLAQKRQAIESEVSRILSSIDTANMSEAEKALAVNDWFALHYKYDSVAYEATVKTEETRKAHRIDGLFIDKTAVCQGYALGYMYVLSKLGVDAIYVSGLGNGGSHGWNMVKIGTKWYHTDVTWADPSMEGMGDMLGLVSHENFLRSDAGIQSTGHSNWSAPYSASEDYDGFWKTNDGKYVSGGMFYKSGNWYYLSGANIVSYNVSAAKTTVLMEEIPWFWADNNGNFVGLNIALHENHIYYNTAWNEIQYIDLNGENKQTLLTLEGDEEVFGLTIDGDTLYYSLMSDIESPLRIESIDLRWFKVEEKGNNIEITANHIPEAGRFFLALYKGKELVSLEMVNFTTQSTSCTLPMPAVQADRAYVYAWSGMKALGKAVELDLAS